MLSIIHCLKQLIQLFEANFPCPDDQVFEWANKHKGLKNSSC